MEQKKSRKGIALAAAVVLMLTAVLTVMLNIRDISAEEDRKTDAGKNISEEEFAPNVWWKAGLSDYSDDLSLISYEVIEDQTAKNIFEAKKNTFRSKNLVMNDTGICYIEKHPDNYQAIQIVPVSPSGEYGNSFTPQTPQKRPETPAVSVSPGNFLFTTYGYGHGVGMSQNGANHYASYSGWSYQQILDHYYPGTSLMEAAVSPTDKVTAGGVTGTVADIVSMVTYNEVGSSMAVEAIKAQAVAAYTYIMYKGGDAPDLCPKPDPPQNVKDAVNSVLGQALYYNGDYALSMFGASSGGGTASCKDIFYQDIPYLTSVPCEYDADCDPHYGTQEVISAEEVRGELERNLGIDLSNDPNNWITIIEGDAGYAAYVVVDGQVTIKGNDFRVYLGLKSPKFTFEYY